MKEGNITPLILVVFSAFLLVCSSLMFVFSVSTIQGISEGEESPVVEQEDEFSEEGMFLTFEATAYCLTGITYSGVPVNRGIVAADPEILPIGSVIEVEAGEYSGIYTVLDTGSAIRGKLIDIYIPDFHEAVEFGRQEIRVRILRHGWENSQPALEGGYGMAG